MALQNTNTNQDLRIIKTEFAIKKAFINLLKKKPYSKISVTEIVTKAQINRNTFYLHYIDKEDLLNSIVSDGFSKYDKLILKIKDNFSNLVETSVDDLNNIVKMILGDIEKDIDFYRLILKDKDMKGYSLKIKDYIRSIIMPFINTNYKKNQMCMEFCFEGTFGTLSRWIENGDSLASIDDISFAITKITYETFKNIKNMNRALKYEK